MCKYNNFINQTSMVQYTTPVTYILYYTNPETAPRSWLTE